MNKKEKIISLFTVLIISIVLLMGCGKKDVPKPISGKYISDDGNSYIMLENYKNGKYKGFNEEIGYCELQFHNVDLSSFKQFGVMNSTGNYITNHKLENASKEEKNKIQEMYETNINMEKQFEANKAKFSFFYSSDEKKYALCCAVDGSGFDGSYETYVSMEYNFKKKAIICDEIKYTLKEE